MKDRDSNADISTTALIEKAISRKSGSAQSVTHDHGIMTITEVESLGNNAILLNTHMYASGGITGCFFSEDIR
jgi:hypothetical protein